MMQTCGFSGGCLKWGAGSACPSGQICHDGNCVAACAPKTCAAQGYACGSWDDGCGATINCGTCSDGKTCSAGKCVANCASRASKKCDGNILYWYNSCGVQEGLAENCGTDEMSSNYRCAGNQIQRQVFRRGCSEDACFATSHWQDTFNCPDDKACRDGDCVASGDAFETESSVVADEIEEVNTKSEMTRAEILNQIAQIRRLLIQLISQLIGELQKQLP